MKNELAAALNFNDNKELPNSSFFIHSHSHFHSFALLLVFMWNVCVFANDRDFHVISKKFLHRRHRHHHRTKQTKKSTTNAMKIKASFVRKILHIKQNNHK